MEKPSENRASIQKRLGEIALSVNNMESMVAFYRDVIQLTLMRLEERMAFFEIAPGYKGHTSILALFARGNDDDKKSKLDHFAFSIDMADFDRERVRLEALGLKVTLNQHNWVQWRSMYVNDPEGNEVELVAFDSSIPKNYES